MSDSTKPLNEQLYYPSDDKKKVFDNISKEVVKTMLENKMSYNDVRFLERKLRNDLRKKLPTS